MEMTQGGHPQVPPAKPPDRGDGQQIPANGAQVICVINEAMSEDEAPMYAALEEQPTAANNVKNGVSLPVTTTNDSGESGGDHVGTSDGGPEVIARDHVGTAKSRPQGSCFPPNSDPRIRGDRKPWSRGRCPTPVPRSRARETPEPEESRQTSCQTGKRPLRQKYGCTDRWDQRPRRRST